MVVTRSSSDYSAKNARYKPTAGFVNDVIYLHIMGHIEINILLKIFT